MKSMACIRRSLITPTRARLLFSQQRFTSPPIYPYCDNNHVHEEDHCNNHQHSGFFLQRRSYSFISFQDPKRSQFSHHITMAIRNGVGFCLPRRNMSTNMGSSSIDYMIDKTMDNVVSSTQALYNEVAIAAADSWLPVSVWMDIFDGIHKFTGLNWWATIVIATFILRTLMLPADILDIKIMANLAVVRNKVQDEGMSEAERHERITKVFREYGITTVYKWMMAISVLNSLSFFFAVYNMVHKVPSLETGGASWFLDLTTSDPFYILPCLTSYTYWIKVEFKTEDGLEECYAYEPDPNPEFKRKRRRVLAVLGVPLYSYFPKAFLFWFITDHLYSLVYGLTIRQPVVKEFLNIPILRPLPSPGSQSKDSKQDFSSLEQFKKYADAQTWQQEEVRETNPTATNQSTLPSPQASKKTTSQAQKSTNQRVLSSSVLRHRIKIMEKKLKERKKNKKR